MTDPLYSKYLADSARKLLRPTLRILSLMLALVLIPAIMTYTSSEIIAICMLIAAAVLTFYLLDSSRFVAACYVFILAMECVGILAVVAYGSIRSVSNLAFVGAVIFSGVFVGRRALVTTVALTAAVVAGLIWAEFTGMITSLNRPVTWVYWLIFCTALMMIGMCANYVRVVTIEALIRQRQDLEERTNLKKALLSAVDQYRTLVESSPMGIAIHISGKMIYLNPAAIAMLGAALPNELIGKSILDLVHPDFRHSIHEQLNNARMYGVFHAKAEQKFLRLDGSVFDVEIHEIPVQFDGAPAIQVSFQDISARKQAEHQIWKQANFDNLTALSNRQMFLDSLTQEITKAKHGNFRLALLFIDLDKFKAVNDALGHSMGDLLLREASRRMVTCIRRSDLVARLGGDEFAILLTCQSADSNSAPVVQNLLNKISEPFHLLGNVATISASIGIAFYPTDAEEVQQLISYADQAMYLAKNRGGNRQVYFTPNLLDVVENRNEQDVFPEHIAASYCPHHVDERQLALWA